MLRRITYLTLILFTAVLFAPHRAGAADAPAAAKKLAPPLTAEVYILVRPV